MYRHHRCIGKETTGRVWTCGADHPAQLPPLSGGGSGEGGKSPAAGNLCRHLHALHSARPVGWLARRQSELCRKSGGACVAEEGIHPRDADGRTGTIQGEVPLHVEEHNGRGLELVHPSEAALEEGAELLRGRGERRVDDRSAGKPLYTCPVHAAAPPPASHQPERYGVEPDGGTCGRDGHPQSVWSQEASAAERGDTGESGADALWRHSGLSALLAVHRRRAQQCRVPVALRSRGGSCGECVVAVGHVLHSHTLPHRLRLLCRAQPDGCPHPSMEITQETHC